jgi:hypothetical protein
MVRSIGRAAFGAVGVLDGAEKVRVPRDPELLPPPTRASAAEPIARTIGKAKERATASALVKLRVRCKIVMSYPSLPGRGMRD